MKSLNEKIIIGTFWTLLTRLTIKSLGVISTIILARILFPDDFGLIALTMALVAFFEIFSSFGFDINIIQKDKVTNNTLNSAWTCKIISGIFLSIVIWLISDFSGTYFNDDRLPLLVSIIAFLPLINSLENIGFVLYRKNLDLKKEFTLGVVSKIVSFVVTISAALLLENYWALVIGMFTNATAKIILSYTLHPYRPSLSLSEAKDLFNFSKWLMINNVLIFFNHKVTDFFIGKQSNSTELGYYTVGYEISNLPTTELVFPLSRAMFPAYSQLKNDKEALRESFVRFTQIVMIFAAPISFGIAITAEELVYVFFGEKWEALIPIISIMALYGLVRCSVQNIGSIFIALGKPNIPVFMSVVRLTVLVPLLLHYVAIEGSIGAAKSVLFVSLFSMPLGYFLVSRLIKLKTSDFKAIFIFPLLAGSAMYFFIEELSFLPIFNEINNLGMLLIKALLGTVFYGVAIGFYYLLFPKNNIVALVANKIIYMIRKKIS